MAIEYAAPAPASPGQQRTLGGFAPWLGFAGSLLIATTAPLWQLAGRPWRLTLPFLPHDGTRPFTVVAFFVGVSLLVLGWLMLLGEVERSAAPERARRRRVLCVAALWCAPVLLGPPLLSSDIYSYAGEGAMVTVGHDPTSEGMYTLPRAGEAEYYAHVDPTWRSRDGGNPYGPVQMGLAAATVELSGHNYSLNIWLLRLLALGGVALSVYGIEQIARHFGVSPPLALAIGIANPIVVLHLAGGGHNDALLMGLMTSGFALALRGRWRWGVVLVALAAAVKLPAAAGLVYLGWNHPGVGASVRRRLKETAKVLVASMALVAALGAAIGIGLGWITAAKNTGATTGTLSFTTQAGFMVNSITRVLGFPESPDLWVNVFRFGGLALAAYLCIRLLPISESIGAVRATAYALLLVVLLGPVVWPWYLAPAIALLAAAGAGKWRPSLVALSAVFAYEVLPSGPVGEAKPVLEHQHSISLLLIVVIVAVVALAPYVSRQWRARRPPFLVP